MTFNLGQYTPPVYWDGVVEAVYPVIGRRCVTHPDDVHRYQVRAVTGRQDVFCASQCTKAV